MTRVKHGKSQTIVFETKLLPLFKLCQICGQAVLHTDIYYLGTQLRVKWDCINGHSGTWTSFPDIRGMPESNFLPAAYLLFTGWHIHNTGAMVKASEHVWQDHILCDTEHLTVQSPEELLSGKAVHPTSTKWGGRARETRKVSLGPCSQTHK